MKRSISIFLVAVALAAPAMARNTMYKLPLADVLGSTDAKARLDGSVKFFFGEGSMPAGAEMKGDDVISRIAKAAMWHNDAASNQGASPSGSSTRATSEQNDDTSACKAAALSAFVGIQEKAKQLGANAVAVVSYYKNDLFSSTTEYECHAGGTGGHLTFKATFAVIPKN